MSDRIDTDGPADDDATVRQVDAARRFEPTAHYAEWREQCPLHHEADHDPPFYVLSRFDDVVQVLRDPEVWQNKRGPGVFHADDGVLGTTDDPDHARQRRLLRSAFVPSAINPLEDNLRTIADELIDGFVEAGSCEFVSSFAAPLPALAIAELLGIDDDKRDDFGRWSEKSVAGLTGGDLDAYREAKTALEDHVEHGVEARIGSDPLPDDVLGLLAGGLRDGVIDRREMRHLGYQLLVAGHETTTSLIGMLLYRLIERPDLMAALRADLSLIPIAIEEAIRFDAPVHGLFRTNAVETELHGVTIPPDTKVQIVNAAANRDPARFPDPDEFRLDRDPSELGRHVGFGWGIHHCIGNHLARLEAQVAFEQLLSRLDDIELAGEPERNDSFVLHGLTALPIRFRPAT